ncbi:hypothetical protein SMICM304S_06936 [Streptomyces microflavus]
MRRQPTAVRSGGELSCRAIGLRGPGERPARPPQGRFVPEDRGVQVAEFGRGRDAQFRVQPPPALLVDREGLGVPAATVEGQHELGAGPLAQGLDGQQRLQFGHQIRGASELQAGGGRALQGAQPQLFETYALGVEGRTVQIVQGPALPQRQPVAKAPLGLLVRLVREAPAPLTDSGFEQSRVEFVLRAEDETVPAVARLKAPLLALGGERGTRASARTPRAPRWRSRASAGAARTGRARAGTPSPAVWR